MNSISISASRMLLVLIASISLIVAPITVTAQFVFDFDSLNTTPVLTYQSNFGPSTINPSSIDSELKSGMVFPRSDGHSYVFASGVWIGGLTYNPDEPQLGKWPVVLKSYDLLTGRYMCVPGEYENGNQYRQDLAEQYKPKRKVESDYEELSVSFHDGDLRVYPNFADPNNPDSTYWLARNMPLGFQFNQVLRGWNSGQLTNCLTIETHCKYVGDIVLDSVFVAGAVSVAIGPSNNTLEAFKDDTCWLSSDDPSSIICANSNSDPKGYGRLGVCEVSKQNETRPSVIRILDYSSIGHVDMYNNYRLMSKESNGDESLAGDRFLIYSKFIGEVSPGDEFSFKIGYVLTTDQDENSDSIIVSKMQALREINTSIDELPKAASNSRSGFIVYNDALVNLTSKIGRYTGSLMICSQLGTTSILQVDNGYADISSLPSGIYYLIQSSSTQECGVSMMILR